ncbi:transcriptional repressor LexA [Tistrella mobilis]|uniref:transcriptional repressor LexA n=1 Tax=Tistrella mobilis TaxID=171437 RepID=UPI00355659EF
MLTRKQHELLRFILDRVRATGVAPSFEEMKDALDLKSKSGIHRLILGLEERGFIRRLAHRARAIEVIRLPDGGPFQMPGQMQGDSPAPAPTAMASANPFVSQAAAQRGPRLVEIGGGRMATPVQQDTQPQQQPQRFRSLTRPPLNAPPRLGRAEDSGNVVLPLYGKIAAGTPIEALSDGDRTVEVPATMIPAGSEYFALEVEGDSMIDAGIMNGDTVIIRRTDTADNGTIVVALIDGGEATLKRLRRRGQSVALEPANQHYETRIYRPDQVKVQGQLIALFRRYA